MNSMNSVENPIAAERLQQPAPAAAGALNDRPEKPFVFRYSIIHRILVYPFIPLTLLVMLRAIGEWDVFRFLASFLLLLVIPLWFVSAVVEVSNSGITLRRLFGLHRLTVEWTDIVTIKPAIMGVGMKLIAREGNSLTISSQIHGYAIIVEVLRRIRPDLFDAGGAREFRKGRLAKYGPLVFLVIATPLAFGSILVPPFLTGLLFLVAVVYYWISTLQAVYLLKVDDDRLFTRSFRRSQELTARQISNIGMIALHNRRGVAKHLVQIELIGGGVLRLSGFREGNEILLGYLKNWWSTYRGS